MKHLLLSLLLSAGAIAGSANAPDASLRLIKGSDMVKEHNIKAGSNAKTRQLAPGVFVTESHGMKKVIINRDNAPARQLPPPVKISAKTQENSGLALFESFEGWDGTDTEWTPEGWTVDMRGEVERYYSWTPSAASSFLPPPSDGNYYYGVSLSSYPQDEWLISPLTKVEDGMNLTFWAYYSPAYLFSLDNIDWDSPTYEYIGEQIVAATLQIWVQAEGEEWTMLHDYADDYKGMSYLELAYLEPVNLEKKTLSLEAFTGKNVKIAFRYVGSDGNTMFIDAVSVGYPALDDVSYLEPLSTLYWGFDGNESMTALEGAIAMQPVFEPITWQNMTYEEGAVYQWTYSDPSTAAPVTSDSQDELTVTYFPDYSSESRMVNNFYFPPTLKASVPGALPGTYTSPYAVLQAGGKPERKLADNSKLEVDLLPFAPQTSGAIYTTVDDPVVGDLALPVFGYNVNTDRYWLNYSLNGEEPNESDFSHLEGIANLIFPNAAPLVVHGVNIYGFGKIGADASLTATIYAMDSEMTRDISTMEVMATATIKGSEVLN
ncbi:MAG: choice-of-anchor J domain-containing protein, partial [Muribaculaceae bacterium]|nr:choice-of-anchor J domain-containing protein [Muribaculaceae bacterium]